MSNWEQKEFGEIVKLSKDKFNPKISNENKICIELEHISKGTGKLIGQTHSNLQLSIKNVFHKGNILLGKLRPNLRKFIYCDFDGVCSSEIWVFVPSKAIHPKYLFYMIQQNRFISYACITSGSKMPRADWNYISTIPFQIPPISKQKEIANILQTWDTAIEKTEALIAAKQKQLCWLHNQFKKHQGQLFSIAELEEMNLLKLGRGKVISKNDFKNYPGGFPVYSSSVSKNGLFGNYGKYMFDDELITWSIDGGGNFFYRNKHKFSVTNVCGYMNVDTSKINCHFLANQLQILHSRQIFDYQSKAHPSVIRKIYKVTLPSLAKQNKISYQIKTAQQEIDFMLNLIGEYHTQKKGLMQKLLTNWRNL